MSQEPRAPQEYKKFQQTLGRWKADEKKLTREASVN